MDGLQKENEVYYQDGCGLLKTLQGSDVRNASSPKVLRAIPPLKAMIEKIGVVGVFFGVQISAPKVYWKC